MSQSDVLARIYQVRVPDGRTGTAFALDVDGHQYIITAKHLVGSLIGPLSISWVKGWEELHVGLVGHCEDEIDISVLYTNQNLPKIVNPNGDDLGIETDLKLAEEVRFYGFPHGLSTPLTSGFPVAFVKRGIVSSFFGTPLGSGTESLFIDGHNNPGFSGGPVVTIRNGEYKVAAVIASYRYSLQKVYGTDSSGQIDEKKTIGYLPENTGITLAHNIKPALDIISKNPIGLSLKEQGQ